MTGSVASTSGRSTTERLIRPTLPELWTFLAVVLPVLAALAASLPTVDLTYQLRAGGEILAGRGIPSIDQWTFTAAGQPWLDQQWGSQVALSAVFQITGWTGLALFRAALVGTVAGLILVAIRSVAPAMRPRSAALLGLGAFIVMAPAMALRPQMLGMALFAGTGALLARRHVMPRGVWLIPLIAAVWTSVHGSFILAPVLVGLAWLEDAAEVGRPHRRTFLAMVATGAATLVNPFGIDVWRYALGLATNRDVTSQISEWRPPSLTDPTGLLFWASVVVAALAAISLSRGALRAASPRLLALAFFASLGAVAARGVAWWPVIAVVALSGLWAGRTTIAAPPVPGRAAGVDLGDRRTQARGSRMNAAVAGLLLVVGVALVPAWRPVDPATNAPSGLLNTAPPGITAALRALAVPDDRIWNPQVWGSWLEFAVPEPLYALDSRIEVIPGSVWAEAAVVVQAGSGWADVLDRAGATIVVTEAAPSLLAVALAGSPAWTSAFADADGTIWIRTTQQASR